MLEVLQPGLLTTVQDGAGRPWAAALGVPRAGAADPDGLADANRVVGNEPDAGGLEMTLLGPTLRALGPCVVALGGADLAARLEPSGRRLRPGLALRLAAGDVVAFGPPVPGTGCRGYLALAGGLDVPIVLGSASTCLPGRFGGLDGRSLVAGDRLTGRDSGPGMRPGGPPSPAGRVLAGSDGAIHLRVVAGPHRVPGAVEGLLAQPWRASPESDRVGLRLAGDPIDGGRGDLRSYPMRWGAVQLPPSGEPIVLLVDAPTVGGYPVVAVVAGVDLGRLGQVGPGDAVVFDLVTIEAAQAALRASRSAADPGATGPHPPDTWERLADHAGSWRPPER